MTTLLERIQTKASLEARRLQFRVQPTPSVLDKKQLVRTLDKNPNVLFLCTGNICRSPLAERYLRSKLRCSTTNVSVDSAGIRTRIGRSSPEIAVDVATEYGVNLADHRSKPVTETELDWSDVVFVMDLHNYYHLRRQFGDHDEKTFFLGGLTAGSSFEIDDPYGGTEESFRSLYDEVITAVDEIRTLLDSRR